MIAMPKDVQEAVHASEDHPVRLTDPATNVQYVLLPAEVYDRIQDRLYDQSALTRDEKRALMLQAGLRAGWDDPEMSVYDDLDPRRQ